MQIRGYYYGPSLFFIFNALFLLGKFATVGLMAEVAIAASTVVYFIISSLLNAMKINQPITTDVASPQIVNLLVRLKRQKDRIA